MSISIKNAQELEAMRTAGKLASEVLDFITPHVQAGITTAELDRLCHDYMVEVQCTVPAPLNYCPPGYQPYPKSICTSVNHQVCHGIPGDRVLKPGGRIVVCEFSRPPIAILRAGYFTYLARVMPIIADRTSSKLRREASSISMRWPGRQAESVSMRATAAGSFSSR